MIRFKIVLPSGEKKHSDESAISGDGELLVFTERARQDYEASWECYDWEDAPVGSYIEELEDDITDN
jgi:hypothetical protein